MEMEHYWLKNTPQECSCFRKVVTWREYRCNQYDWIFFDHVCMEKVWNLVLVISFLEIFDFDFEVKSLQFWGQILSLIRRCWMFWSFLTNILENLDIFDHIFHSRLQENVFPALFYDVSPLYNNPNTAKYTIKGQSRRADKIHQVRLSQAKV